MRYRLCFFMLGITFFSLAACISPIENDRFEQAQSPISTLIPLATPTSLIQTGAVTYSISSRLDQTARIPIVISGWSTYTSTLGFSLAYPTGWQISEEKQGEQLYHLTIIPTSNAATQEHVSFLCVILLHPQVVNGQPSNAIPNEGAETYWPTPLNIPNANALFYAWGAQNFDGRRGSEKWIRGGVLRASYYSTGLDLELLIDGGYFDDLSVEMAQQVGFVETVEERFPVFYHIAQSVRFVK